MNNKNNLQEQIDLLVEGELNPTQQQELFLRLDSTDQGWKSCAISFMESQAIRSVIRGADLGLMVQTGDAQVLEKPVKQTAIAEELIATKRPIAFFGLVKKAAVLAALLGIAFFLGTQTKPDGQNAIAKNDAQKDTPLPAELEKVETAPPEQIAPDESELVELIGHVTMDDSTGNKIRLPILSGPGTRGPWVKESTFDIPSAHREKLGRAGWKVERNRRTVSLNLRGEELTIPIEQLSYEYVGNPIF